jgi:hypothetical protein
MIDAVPSLRAAEGLPAAAMLAYLRSTGWTAKPSRVPGVTVLSKDFPDADEPIHIVLPDVAGFADEHRRVADALRTIEAVEERSLQSIVDDVRKVAAKSIKKPRGKASAQARKKTSKSRRAS